MTEEAFSLPVGIVVALVCAIIQSFGLTLQRKSHLHNDELPVDQRKRDWKRPTWLLGFAIFLLSNTLGSVWQLGALPIVILAPLGGVSLVWNAIFARFILGDRFTRYLIFGTFLIAGGAVLVALFGTVDEPTHSLDELLALYSRPAFIVWISLLCATIFGVLIIAHVMEVAANKQAGRPLEKRRLSGASRRRRWSGSSNNHSYYTMHSPSSTPSSPTTSRFLRRAAAVEGEELTQADADRLSKEESRRLLIGLAYGAVSGTLSGLCLLFAKTSTELLIISIVDQQNQFKRVQPWFILLVLLVSAVLQLWYLNRSLRLVGPTLICPTAFCLYNVSSIFNGLLYYDQVAKLSGLNIGLVALGVVILLSGVWVVSLKTADPISLDNAAPLETTPLIASIVSEPESEVIEEEEEESAEDLSTRKRLLELFFGPEDQPRGFSIGIGAASPGFAVRPKSRSITRGRSVSVDSPLSPGLPGRTWYGIGGEPYVGIDSPVEEPKQEGDEAPARRRWPFWKRRRRSDLEEEEEDV